jgi:hypothetical protein
MRCCTHWGTAASDLSRWTDQSANGFSFVLINFFHANGLYVCFLVGEWRKFFWGNVSASQF